MPGARVTAVELSPDALAYLRANNAACGCPLCVVQADVLDVYKRQGGGRAGEGRHGAAVTAPPCRKTPLPPGAETARLPHIDGERG